MSNQAVEIQKLVSTARALVTYQVGLPIGVTRLSRIIVYLGWQEQEEYQLFRAYLSETDDLPIGTERLLCDREALRRFDVRLERINALYRDGVFETCFRIIDEFGKEEVGGGAESSESNSA